MRLVTNFFKAAVAVSCLAIAACGGDSTTDSQSSTSSTNANASVLKSVAAGTASPNGTAIPAATQITDGSSNVWTVVSGVIQENGAAAGYSNAVTLLLYDNNTIYQENSAGGWWSWTGSTWEASSDPRKVASANGATIPSATQITDTSDNVWAVSGGVIYKNGATAGYSSAVTLLVYESNVIYQENSAGGWWSWTGSTWEASSDPRKVVSSSGTTIPTVSQIIDSSDNVWTVSGGLVYKNGSLAGYTSGVTHLVYENGLIYQENAAGGWWSWNGSGWASSSDPLSSNSGGGGGAVAPTISGSPAASDTAGQAYSFVPTTTNSGGGTLTFSISNMPAWASFNATTGALSGTPSSAQVGSYANIVIGVSNGSASASLAAFSINVTASPVAATGAADLSWTPPTQNTDGTPLTDLAGYTIYYGTNSGSLTQTIQLASPSATSYVVSNLNAGTYYFAVQAYSSDGTRSTLSALGSKTIL